MPLIQRVIHPIDLVRSPLHESLKGNDELQSVNMNALVGILRQLASLSKHAETLFADLFNEAAHTMNKAQGMESRVQCLAEKISTMNVTIVTGNTALNDAPLHYASQHQVDQNVVSTQNRTQCIRERHLVAELPPNLSLITCLRTDDKDALRMYTDPDFFRNNWIRKMREEMVKEKKDKTRRRKRGQSMKKDAPRPVVKKEYYLDSLGNEVKIREKMIGRSVDQYSPHQSPDHKTASPYAVVTQGQFDQDQQQEILYEETDDLPPPPEFDLPPPPAFEDGFGNDGFDLPPPQDGDLSIQYHHDTAEPLYAEPEFPTPVNAPLAPRAPPAPNAPAAPNAPPAPCLQTDPLSPSFMNESSTPRQLSPVKQTPSPAPPPQNTFLNSIQNYKTSALRKVEEIPKPKEESQYASMDVMSILSRRQVIQLSESEGESDNSDFTQDWDEN